MTLDATPDSLHGAVAAGILGAGPVILGTSEACAHLLAPHRQKVEAGEDPTAVATELAERTAASPARTCRASAIPSTSRSIPARSASSRWRTSAG